VTGIPDVLVLVPTRERPGNARRLVKAVAGTAALDTRIVFAVDDDDTSYDGVNLAPAAVLRGPRRDVGAWTSDLAAALAEDCRFLASLGDDHVPVTAGWDALLVAALDGRMGVAYGNDLHQGAEAPTACLIPSPVITALGYMAPPGPVHLFIDLFWKRLGQDLGCLEYLPEVVVEHVHPHAGKAPWDDSYRRSDALSGSDGAAYDRFLANQWPDDLSRLKGVLGLV
jgi:hypothetical protein